MGKAMEVQNVPLSVLGSATVTLTVQHSQQTSSSPRDSQALRRLFSKNWTATWPLVPASDALVLVVVAADAEEEESSWRARAAARCSIMVSSSASLT